MPNVKIIFPDLYSRNQYFSDRSLHIGFRWVCIDYFRNVEIVEMTEDKKIAWVEFTKDFS